jgi:hypothetical protein
MLRSGRARLPRPYVEGGEKPGRKLRLALAAAGALVLVLLVGRYMTEQAELYEQQQQQRIQRPLPQQTEQRQGQQPK